jgi:AbrB family looped-hinge helix DNA binding protein
METSVVTRKGQIVIPARIRHKFGIKRGTRVAFIEQNGKLIMQLLNKHYFKSMAGILGTKGKLLRGLMEEKKRERQL